MKNIEHNFLKSNKKIRVYHCSVRKTGFSSRLIQTHLTFYLFSENGILKVSKLCSDPRTKIEKQQLCFWDYKQKSKLLRALGVSERQMQRKLAELKRLGLIYEKFGNLHISHPFEGVGKYTLIPLRHGEMSILNKKFPLLEFVMQCIKRDALDPSHSQCKLNFGQNSRTLRRKNALLNGFDQADKKVTRLRSILLIKKTTDLNDQRFLKFEERENTKREKFWVVPRKQVRKFGKFLYCLGRRFEHTQEIHLEAYKQAKKQGAGFGLRWLEYAPNYCNYTQKTTFPWFCSGKEVSNKLRKGRK